MDYRFFIVVLLLSARPILAGAAEPKPARHVVAALLENSFPVPAYATDGMPLGYTLRFGEARLAQRQNALAQYVAFFRGLGMNHLSFDLPWSAIETEPGRFDFSEADVCLNTILKLGFSLQLKLNSRIVPQWALTNQGALIHGADGAVVEKGFIKAPYHSLADSKMNQALKTFYREVARHYAGRSNIFYSSAFGASLESEYHHSVWTDYSPAAQQQMRAWLPARYASLGDLNTAWRTNYATWAEVRIAWQPPQTMLGELPDPRYVDFIKYREWAAAQFFGLMQQGLREGDPKAQYGPQVGRIAGPVEMFRGTPGVFHWSAGCDWIFVDPSPADDYAWELALARADGRKVAVEIDGPAAFRGKNLGDRLPELYAEQTRLSYEHGADFVSFANWSQEQDYRHCLEMFRQVSEIKQRRFSRPPAELAVYLSKWDVYLLGHPQGSPLALARDCFLQLAKNGRRVDVLMDDTILANPQILDRYKTIHVPGARFVARAVWKALQSAKTSLVLGKELERIMDEQGNKYWRKEP